jgi:hypothetical protein
VSVQSVLTAAGVSGEVEVGSGSWSRSDGGAVQVSGGSSAAVSVCAVFVSGRNTGSVESGVVSVRCGVYLPCGASAVLISSGSGGGASIVQGSSSDSSMCSDVLVQ